MSDFEKGAPEVLKCHQITDIPWGELAENNGVSAFLQDSELYITPSLDELSEVDELAKQRTVQDTPFLNDCAPLPKDHEPKGRKYACSHKKVPRIIADSYSAGKYPESKVSSASRSVIDEFKSDGSEPFFSHLPDIGDIDDVDLMLRNYDYTFEHGSNHMDEPSWFNSTPSSAVATGDTILPEVSLSMANYGIASDVLYQLTCSSRLHVSSQPAFFTDNKSGVQGSSLSASYVNFGSQQTFDEKLACIDDQMYYRGSFQNMSDGPLVYVENASDSSGPVQRRLPNITASNNVDIQTYSELHEPSQVQLNDASNNRYHEELQSGQSVCPVTADNALPSNILESTSISSSDCPGIRLDRRVKNSDDHLTKTPDIIFQQMTESSYFGVPSQSPMEHAAEPQVTLDSVHTKRNQADAGIGYEDENIFLVPSLPQIVSSSYTESSHSASICGEVSGKGISFLKLREVMNQLDDGVKLCIRDGLYRLARSAEQRHTNNRLSRNKLRILENHRSTSFSTERQTEHIDCSIAHLLFHRPSDPIFGSSSHGVPVGPYISNNQFQDAII